MDSGLCFESSLARLCVSFFTGVELVVVAVSFLLSSLSCLQLRPSCFCTALLDDLDGEAAETLVLVLIAIATVLLLALLGAFILVKVTLPVYLVVCLVVCVSRSARCWQSCCVLFYDPSTCVAIL